MTEATAVPAVYVPQKFEPVNQFLTDHVHDLAALVDMAVPAHERDAFAGRLIRIALHAMERSQVSQALAKCTPESVFLAVANAAALGLEPTGVLGEGALIPYGQTCTFQPMYRGLIALATRGGDVLKIEARVWYEGDHFIRQYGTDPRIEHIPCAAADRGRLIGSYAVAKLANGETIFEVCDEDEIAAIKSKAHGTNRSDSPWNPKSGFESEMYRKSAVKRLGKYLPMRRGEDSFALRRALAYDDAVQSGRVIPISEIDPTAPEVDALVEARTETKKEAMKEQLREAKAVAVEAGPVPDVADVVVESRTPSEMRAALRSQIANADLPQMVISDLAQTAFGKSDEVEKDADGRVDVLALSVDQLDAVGDLLDKVLDALETDGSCKIISYTDVQPYVLRR